MDGLKHSGLAAESVRQINAHLPSSLYDLIVSEARLVNETPSRYLAMIAQTWIEQGAPPVMVVGAAMGMQRLQTRRADRYLVPTAALSKSPRFCCSPSS
jgi:hypothetical protein